MTQQDANFRTVTEIKGPNQLASTMYRDAPDGSEMKLMEMALTR
jgi:hypothetical protein